MYMTIRAFGNFEIKNKKLHSLHVHTCMETVCMVKFLPRMNQSVHSDLPEDYIVTMYLHLPFSN